MEKKEEPSLEW